MKFNHEKIRISKLLEEFKRKVIIINNVYDEDGEKNEDEERSEGYQRDSNAWNDLMKQSLIKSILSNKPMPSLIFWESNQIVKINLSGSETQSSVQEVIDGQQRIKTIEEFFDGKFMLNGKNNEEYDNYFKNVKEKNYSNLKDEGKRNFSDYYLSYTILSECTVEAAIEVFVVMNKNGKKLVAHEIREAHSNKNGNNEKFIELSKEVSKSLVEIEIDTSKDNFSKSKVREFVFKLFHFFNSNFVFFPQQKGALDTLYKNKIDFSNKKEFVKNFNLFSKCFSNYVSKNHFVSKMYIEIFFKLFIEECNSNENAFMKKLGIFFTKIDTKNNDNSYKYENERSKITLRSSIQSVPKKEAYDEIVKFINEG